MREAIVVGILTLLTIGNAVLKRNRPDSDSGDGMPLDNGDSGAVPALLTDDDQNESESSEAGNVGAEITRNGGEASKVRPNANDAPLYLPCLPLTQA